MNVFPPTPYHESLRWCLALIVKTTAWTHQRGDRCPAPHSPTGMAWRKPQRGSLLRKSLTNCAATSSSPSAPSAPRPLVGVSNPSARPSCRPDPSVFRGRHQPAPAPASPRGWSSKSSHGRGSSWWAWGGRDARPRVRMLVTSTPGGGPAIPARTSPGPWRPGGVRGMFNAGLEVAPADLLPLWPVLTYRRSWPNLRHLVAVVPMTPSLMERLSARHESRRRLTT